MLTMLNRALGFLAALSLFAMMILVLMQIFYRYCLEIPLPQSQELAIFAMVYVTMLGCAMAIRSKTHVAVNFLVDRYPPRLAETFRILAYLVTIAFFVLLFWQGCNLTLRSMTQKATATGIPNGYIVAAIPIGSALSILFLCQHIVRAARSLKTLCTGKGGQSNG